MVGLTVILACADRDAITLSSVLATPDQLALTFSAIARTDYLSGNVTFQVDIINSIKTVYASHFQALT